MQLTKRTFFILALTLAMLVSATGCGSLVSKVADTPTATPAPPTATPIPPTATPVPTDTPLPSPTFTEAPPPTPTNTLPPPIPPTSVQPTPTAHWKEAILVYYINKDEAGPYGCGEALWFLNTGVRRSESYAKDITFALQRLLTYYSPYIGILYHAGYDSRLAVGNVEVDGEMNAQVYLTGEYVKTDDPCDGPRFRDQIKATVKQFPGIRGVRIFINGVTIGDVMSRK